MTPDEIRYLFYERAGIIENDGGVTRQAAYQAAFDELFIIIGEPFTILQAICD